MVTVTMVAASLTMMNSKQQGANCIVIGSICDYFADDKGIRPVVLTTETERIM